MLLQQLSIPSEVIIQPELLQLIVYQNAWDKQDVDALAMSADTVAMMIIVLPSQHQVCLITTHYCVDDSLAASLSDTTATK